MDGFHGEVILLVNGQVPPGIALIPRSLDVPINSPTVIESISIASGKM
jgi:hypothetical protein